MIISTESHDLMWFSEIETAAEPIAFPNNAVTTLWRNNITSFLQYASFSIIYSSK